jgi:hypothetical protein
MVNGLEHFLLTSLKAIFQKCKGRNYDDVRRFEV